MCTSVCVHFCRARNDAARLPGAPAGRHRTPPRRCVARSVLISSKLSISKPGSRIPESWLISTLRCLLKAQSSRVCIPLVQTHVWENGCAWAGGIVLCGSFAAPSDSAALVKVSDRDATLQEGQRNGSTSGLRFSSTVRRAKLCHQLATFDKRSTSFGNIRIRDKAPHMK